MDSTQAFKPAHFDPQKEMQNAQRLSISQAARILNISTSTLRRLEQEGKISSVRDKNHYRHYGLGDVRALKDALVHEHSEKNAKQKPLNETVAVNRSIPKGDANQRTKRKLLRKVTKTVSIVTVCLVLASLLSFTYRSKTSQHVGDSLALRPEIGNVLALRSNAPSLEYVVNIPSRFAQGVNFLNSVQVQDDLDVDGVARLSTIEELEAIDETTETTIENALDIQGDVTGEGLQNVQIAANVITDNELADTITYSGILNVTGSLLLDGDELTSSADQLNLLDELNTQAGGIVYSETDGLNVSQPGTVGQILISQGSGAPTWINQSDLDISGLGDLTPEQLLRSDASDFYTTGVLTFNTGTSLTLASGAEFNCIDCVTLGSETLGNYVASVVSGSGIQTNAGPPGEGTLHTLSLGALTADWQQTGPFDVILSNASSELQILESSGGTFYGNIDVGDLSADRVYTLPNASGEFSLLGQSISNAELVNDSLTVNPGTGLSGGGLVTLGGSVSLSSTLGTSIEGGEITDATIEAVDLETSNAPTEDFFLSYDSATGGFTWLEVTGGGAGDITEVIAGAGLTGGSTIGSATLDVGAGTGIIVGANDISVNQATNFVWTGVHSWTNTLTNSASQAGFSLTLGDDGGVDTVSAISVDATSAATGDADNLYGISINDLALASGTVNEIAMRIGTGWDDILNYNGTTVIDGDGTIPTSRLFGTLITLAGDSGSGTVTQGETVTVSGGTNLTSSHAGDTVTVNLDSTITLAGDLTVQGQNVNFDNATDIDIDDALPGALTISEGTNNYLAINTSNASEMISLGNTTTNPGFSLLGTGVATFGGTLSVSGDTIGLNNDVDADNVFGLLASGGSAGSNLYWGDDLLCDVSQTNCGWVTSVGVYTSWSVADSSGDIQNVVNSNVLRFTSSDSNVLTNLTGIDDGDDVLDLSIRRDGDIIASGGLTGDVNNILVGSDANDVTLAVGAGNGILVNTDNVAVNEDFNFTFTGNNTFTPGGGDDLDINLDSDSVLTIDSALVDPVNANSVTHTLTNTSVSGIQNALYIDNAPSSGVTESLLVLDNSDDNTQVTNAIEFVNGGTGFANLFNVSGVLISSTEFEILDNAISLTDEVSGILPVANGGTGLDASLIDDGELLIGNDTTNGFVRSVLSAGSGITITNAPGAITIGHTDTSSQSSLDNSAAVVIQDVTLDTFGHISGLGTVDLSTLFDNYSSWVIADDDTGTYSVASGGTLRFTSSDGNILTDVTDGDDADENLDLTIRREGDVIAGNGLTGDVNNILVGSDADDVTLAVGAGTGIAVNANDIAINQATSFGWTGIHSWTNTLTDTSSQADFNLTLANDGNADILSAINIDITSTATGDSDILYAINLGDVSSPQAEVTETAMRIGDGYDNLFEFEGTADGFETVIRLENPTADRVYTIPFETLDAEFCMSTGNCSGIGVQTFTTIDTPSGSDPVADTSSDSLQFLVSGSNLTITGADNPETVTFNIDETALAGAGLAANADALDIGAGNGITVNANDVAVNQAYGFTFTGNNTFTPGSTDDVTINLDSDSLFSVNQAFTGTTTANSLTYVLTNSSTSGTQNGLYLDNAASTGTTESLLVLDNSDADTAVTNAIEIIEAGGVGFTNILNLNGVGLSSTELGILDSGITLGSETAGDYVAGFTAGGGLTGDASGEGSNPTLAVGAGTGITVNANDVAVNQATNFAWTGIHSWTNAITNTGSQADFNLTLGDDGDVDTVSAINIDATSAATSDADNLFGLTISNLTGADGTVTEYAFRVGTGWDDIFNYNGTTVIDGDGTIPVGQLNGTLFSVSDTSTTELVSQGETVYFADSTTINATVSATNQVTHNVVANTLDYIHLQDTLDLDAITETNLAGNNLIFDLDGAGDLLIHDGGAALASFNDTSVIAFTPANTTTASGRVLIDGSTTNSTATAGLLDIDATTVTDGFEAINLDLNISDDAGADTVIGAFITIDNNATTVDDTVYGLSIVNEDQGAGTDADMMADALIRLRNDDDGVSLSDALLITAISGGGITDAVDASDTTLLNALNAGQNFILGDGIRQFSSSSTVWTFEDTSNNDLLTLTDNSNVGDLVLTGTGSFYGTTLGLNNDASVTNVLSFNAGAAGVATGDLYWGNDLLCDVSETNCGWSTGASGTPNFDEVYAESITDGELTMEIDNASGLNFNLTTTGDFTIQAAGNSFARFLDNGTTQLGQTDYVSFATTGDMTFVGSDAASIIGPNGGNLNIVAGTAQNIVLSTDLTNRVGVGTGTTPSGKFEVEVANNTELTGFVLDANDADQIAMQIESSQNTADIIDIIGNSLTTGRGIDISLDALTNGTGVNIKSASTTLGVATEGGSLLNLEWTANATSSADLFSIDIGQNSTLLGNLFVASDNGSDVFAIATAGVTSSVPFQINTGGDLSVGYDITMTNQTASKIESYGPLTIETGELFENNDLVLKTYGTGEVAVQGGGLSLETGEFLALDSNESGDSYIRHNNTGNDYISVYTNATEVVRFMNDGSVDGNTTFDANQFDVAEAYPTFDTSLQAAQVVMIDPVQTPGQSSLVTKATNSYRDQVVGIVSTSPGFTLGAGSFATEFCQDVNEKGVDTIVNEYLEGLAVQEGLDEQLVEDSEIVNGQTIVEAETAIKVEAKRKAAEACLTPSKVLVALAGRVPVEVAWEGEDIRVGDPLTISHEPGKATKATTAGMIVGRALEGYTQADNDTGKTTVMAMLQVNWWGGGEYANNQSASWRSNNANIEDDLGGDALGDVTLRNDLTVLGKTNLGDTSVIGTLSLGSTSIRDGAINAVAKTLYLQNEFAAGNVDIFNGKIVMTTAGDVTVRGRIEADTVVAGEFKINQEKQTTGRAIINAGQRTLTVYNSAVKANSKVFVTLRTVTDKSLIVTNIYDSQAFTVELPSVTNKNIEFDYWIVGVE